MTRKRRSLRERQEEAVCFKLMPSVKRMLSAGEVTDKQLLESMDQGCREWKAEGKRGILASITKRQIVLFIPPDRGDKLPAGVLFTQGDLDVVDAVRFTDAAMGKEERLRDFLNRYNVISILKSDGLFV